MGHVEKNASTSYQVINLEYGEIDSAIDALTEWLGAPTTRIHGRSIGMGAESKAKWMGPGWMMWTDHYRTPPNKITVQAFLSFHNDSDELIWRLKYPSIGR